MKTVTGIWQFLFLTSMNGRIIGFITDTTQFEVQIAFLIAIFTYYLLTWCLELDRWYYNSIPNTDILLEYTYYSFDDRIFFEYQRVLHQLFFVFITKNIIIVLFSCFEKQEIFSWCTYILYLEGVFADALKEKEHVSIQEIHCRIIDFSKEN